MFSVAGKLLPFFREHPWRLCLIIVLGLLASLAEGIGISLFIPFLENLEQTDAVGEGIWIVEFLEGLFARIPEQYRLLVIAGSIFASIFIKAGFSFAHQVMFHSLDARFIHDLRSLIVRQLLTVPFGYYAHAQTGQIVNTLSNETP